MFNFRNLCRTLEYIVVCLLMAGSARCAYGRPAASDTAQPANEATTATEELNAGVAAYKSAQYGAAMEHFRRALKLDPNSVTAKAYLATALAENVVPGRDTPENLKTAQDAVDLFQQVLEKSPHDVNSMKQIAGIYFSIGKLDDAKAWQKRVLKENSKDPEAAYTVGVIDWQQAYRNALAALQRAGFNDDGRGNVKAPRNVMTAMRDENGPLVEEALEDLLLAVKYRPDYSEAMSYLNLVYRRKADLDWDNDLARADDLAKAKEWADKAKETRGLNGEMIARPSSAQQ